MAPSLDYTYILHDPLVGEHDLPVLELMLGEVYFWYGDVGAFVDGPDGIGRLSRRRRYARHLG